MKEDIAALFKKITHGVYVIGATDDNQYNAFTAAWVMHVSFNPLVLAVSVSPNHSSYSMIQNSNVFSVNVLKKDQLDLAAHFGKSSSTDKLADIKWHKDQTGTPVLDDAMAFFECEVINECKAGDHMVLVGRVINGDVIDLDALPLLYRETDNMNGSINLYRGFILILQLFV